MQFLAKLFFFTLLLFVTVILHLAVKEIKNTRQQFDSFKIFKMKKNITTFFGELKKGSNQNKVKNDTTFKYILQWTNPKNCPFEYMLQGNKVFIERKCQYTNCYVTSNRSLLGDVSKFDVIAFAGPEVAHLSIEDLTPDKRSPHQKYVFASIESAHNYPLYANQLDKFFNWTWTFKLDSEARWGYIVVRDANMNVIGPNKIMHWMKLQDMDPVSGELSAELKNKTKAVAWFVSNCRTRSRREDFTRKLYNALRPYNLEIDIYGDCGPFECSRKHKEVCFEIIKRYYHFYLSFENSISEDYVTEKLLSALRNNAIPIVYGGANYTRFMPDDIYLNARELGPVNLAKKIKYLIDNPDQYKEYFRWKSHYSYHNKNAYPETDDYCGFCALLNNEEMVKKTSIYSELSKWWNDPDR